MAGTPSSVKIDELVTLRLDQATPEIAVTAPDGSRTALSSLGQGVFEFAGTRRVGVYDVTSAEGTIGAFAVNLFDRRESDLAVTRDRSFNLGQVEVASSNQPLAAERPAWKWLILAAVCVLIFEWYVYNRRVYF